MAVNIKFSKVNPNAIIPSKRDEDMGFDIYACFEDDYMIFYPHETRLIPTGIASACDSEYGFILRERGSTGSKGISLRCGVLDSGYRGEWFIGLTNTTNNIMFISKLPEKATKERYVDEQMSRYTYATSKAEEYAKSAEAMLVERAVIYPYSKAIAQALVVPVPKVEVKEVSYEDLKEIKSERGMGALGSSNK